MKKFLLSIAALFSMATASYAIDQDDDNGFGLKLTVGICGDKFGDREFADDVTINGVPVEGNDDDLKVPGMERKNTPLFGLSMDNRWYVAQPGKFGIGITARWLDMSFGKSKIALNGVDMLNGTTVKADFLMPGIVGTYYMNDDMAIDAFISVGPSLTFQTMHMEDENLEKQIKPFASSLGFDIDDTDAEFGASYYFGAAFRYKVFQAGIEYNYAKLTSMDWFEEDDDDDYFSNFLGDVVTTYRRNNFRIFVGFKF